MPITERQKETLNQIFSQLNGHELVKVAGIVYQTILEAKLPSGKLMALGKMIFAGVGWSEIPNDMRFPFVRATEEYMLKQMPDLFDIMPEPQQEEPQQPAAPAAEAAPDFEGEIGDPADDGDLAAIVDAASGGNSSNGNGSAKKNVSEGKPEKVEAKSEKPEKAEAKAEKKKAERPIESEAAPPSPTSEIAPAPDPSSNAAPTDAAPAEEGAPEAQP